MVGSIADFHLSGTCNSRAFNSKPIDGFRKC